MDLTTVNHEFCASLCKDEFQEVPAEATQSVFVHDHNLFDHSLEDLVQKGLQTFAFEVESAGDVCDGFVSWVGGLEILDLSVKITSLVGRGDSGIDDSFCSIRCLLAGCAQKSFNVFCFVQSLSILAYSDCGY